MQLVSIKDLIIASSPNGPKCPKSCPLEKICIGWIGGTKFVQIAKSVSQTFGEEICDKEMHLVFVQMLS